MRQLSLRKMMTTMGTLVVLSISLRDSSRSVNVARRSSTRSSAIKLERVNTFSADLSQAEAQRE